MKRAKSRETRDFNPLDTSSHKTERSGVAILMRWMCQIINDRNLDLGMPDVETSSDDKKMPDMVVYESSRSKKVLCVIEAKLPFYDVFDESLKDDARKKANNRGAKYFATTNFRTLIWWKTQSANDPALSEEQQIIEKYNISNIESLDEIENIRYSEAIKRSLRDFLTKLYSVHSGKEPEPRLAIDEFLVFRIHEKIMILANYYRRVIDDCFHKDSSFAENLEKWFRDQNWNFTRQYEDFAKIARQTAYLLVNKILFYSLLQAKRPEQLDPLEIIESRTQSSLLQSDLQSYFSQALKIDYETIYTTDFIDTIAFPDSKEIVKEIKELTSVLRKYDFSKLGYDIIGRIFERLIPREERHNLGQYFTSPDVVDLILNFCLNHEDDKILDPSCGAGTFLVRTYQHKKLMNQRLSHESILETLWGNDIAKFPAHLATINLAINDLSSDRNYPNILHEDFFRLIVGESGFDPENWRKSRAKTLGIADRDIIYPRWFDAIIGNPPYTRQEEISETGVDKVKLIENALKVGESKIAEISKRASIHAYFFVHGTKFLKNGGFFGFIVSNSWLDVDYGKGLQEFFLKNYKIIAIIESKIERWFEEADINTSIIILQKCDDAEERDNNLARFVYLKKQLRDFIPPANDKWEEQTQRINEIEKLKRTILAHNSFYENDDMRIYPKSQKELWIEGFDSEENKYIGAKWGKYLRAPEIFFKILEKGKGKSALLKDIAEVRRGYIPCPYEIFRLKQQDIKVNKIPNHYLKETISSPTEYDKIIIDEEAQLPYYLLIVNRPLDKIKEQNLKIYLSKAANKVERAKNNPKDWFCLQKRNISPIIWPRTPYNRHIVFWNKKGISVIDHIEIIPYSVTPKILCAVMNSTLFILFREIYGRTNLGGGALKNEVADLKNFICPQWFDQNVESKINMLFDTLVERKPQSIYDEFGASTIDEVSLDKIKSDRRELDKIIMGDILGLSDDEQLEVYRAVIDLVKSRIDKAKSLENDMIVDGISMKALIDSIIKAIDTDELKRLGVFYREKVLSLPREALELKEIPYVYLDDAIVEKDLFGWKITYNERRGIRNFVRCRSEEEAQYIRVLNDTGFSNIVVPKDEEYLKSILPELEYLKSRVDEIIDPYVRGIINKSKRSEATAKVFDVLRDDKATEKLIAEIFPEL